MTPELKERWAQSLEGGDFQQIQGSLREDDKDMCCLGVLCEIVSHASWRTDNCGCWTHRGESTMPADSLLCEVGLSFENAQNLAAKNDEGCSFVDIAKLVRKLPT